MKKKCFPMRAEICLKILQDKSNPQGENKFIGAHKDTTCSIINPQHLIFYLWNTGHFRGFFQASPNQI